jgi:predicted alpha/beta superfamily hydrolase
MHIQIINIEREIKPKYQRTHYRIEILQPKSSEQPND